MSPAPKHNGPSRPVNMQWIFAFSPPATRSNSRAVAWFVYEQRPVLRGTATGKATAVRRAAGRRRGHGSAARGGSFDTPKVRAVRDFPLRLRPPSFSGVSSLLPSRVRTRGSTPISFVSCRAETASGSGPRVSSVVRCLSVMAARSEIPITVRLGWANR